MYDLLTAAPTLRIIRLLLVGTLVRAIPGEKNTTRALKIQVLSDRESDAHGAAAAARRSAIGAAIDATVPRAMGSRAPDPCCCWHCSASKSGYSALDGGACHRKYCGDAKLRTRKASATLHSRRLDQ